MRPRHGPHVRSVRSGYVARSAQITSDPVSGRQGVLSHTVTARRQAPPVGATRRQRQALEASSKDRAATAGRTQGRPEGPRRLPRPVQRRRPPKRWVTSRDQTSNRLRLYRSRRRYTLIEAAKIWVSACSDFDEEAGLLFRQTSCSDCSVSTSQWSGIVDHRRDQ
jgi:hypothetical protein